MLMPLLVRLTDSEIKAADCVISKVANSLQDALAVAEEVGAIGLSIDNQPLLSDLHIKPVYGNVQLGGQFVRGYNVGAMGPSRTGAP